MHCSLFTLKKNDKQDAEYEKNLQYLHGTTLEDFEVDKRFLLQDHIKSEQRISVILHEYVNGKKSTFENATVLVSVAQVLPILTEWTEITFQAQIEKQNEAPIEFHSKHLFTNDKTRIVMAHLSNCQTNTTTVYEICFQTQDDYSLYKTSIEVAFAIIISYIETYKIRLLRLKRIHISSL